MDQNKTKRDPKDSKKNQNDDKDESFACLKKQDTTKELPNSDTPTGSSGSVSANNKTSNKSTKKS